MICPVNGGPLDGGAIRLELPPECVGKRPFFVWSGGCDYLYESVEPWDGHSPVLFEHTATAGRESVRVERSIGDGGGL